jgi:diaminopimelate epimerase
VQQCGNGARCFARYVYDKGLTDKTEIQVETASGVIVLYIEADGLVRVNMGAPNFNPASLPFNQTTQQDHYSVEVEGQKISLGAVSVGNPHALILVNDIQSAPVEALGEALESHVLFPERVNVGFAQIIDPTHIKLRVYERGAAETLACGTGACAAMVILKKWRLLADQVSVSLPGGDLVIRWNGELNSPVWMSGPAVSVFEGSISV